MICLLCYETNDESIVLDSDEGKQLNISSLLFKYFRFCFDVSSIYNENKKKKQKNENQITTEISFHILFLQFEPIDGDLCLKCWQKTLAFHEFYVQIESVHETISDNKVTVTVKTEAPEATTIKCDPTFVEDYDWSFNDDFSNDSDGKT